MASPPAAATSTSRRPYLIRAMHEWICDNQFTPHLVIDATADGVTVPDDHVSEGKIILNISDRATEALHLGNETISFATRFSGSVHSVRLPCKAVLGIYARETGEGMIFTSDPPDDEPGPDDDQPPAGPGRPTLKVIK
ncbi:MAG: ClpXP protease specificity-enhancing factor [Gammaproteobacteria bacterium]|nr:ClpXP protease specificity-enhancing factor [Gammaproteobacteria bacterium]NNF62461.1 ClpXP protease specificity-enhancing factor [Gammaproteobacteria bacterium]NNM21813.1 ClpXP protease specificity-enhancing factor [Gammaproteobacteria bacterium]